MPILSSSSANRITPRWTRIRSARARHSSQPESGARVQGPCQRGRSFGDADGRAEHRHRDARHIHGAISAPDMTGFTYTRDFSDGERRLHVHARLHRRRERQRQEMKGQSHHRVQVVELRLSDTAHERVGRDRRFRLCDRRQRRFRRHRRRGALVRRELRDLERSRQSQRMGGRGKHTTALNAAAGNVATGLIDNAFTMNVIGGCHAGDGGVGTTRFRDPGLPNGSHQRHRDREPDRHHHEHRAHGRLDQRTRGRRAGQGVRDAAVEFDIKAYVLAYFTGEMPAQ